MNASLIERLQQFTKSLFYETTFDRKKAFQVKMRKHAINLNGTEKSITIIWTTECFKSGLERERSGTEQNGAEREL